MDPITARGRFWLPGEEEREVPGRLRWDVENGGELELEDRLSPDDLGRDHRLRIHGRTDSGDFTLEDCWTRTPQWGLSPFAHEDFHFDSMYEGAHFGHNEDPTFDSMSLRVENLTSWLGVSAVASEFDLDRDDDRRVRNTYTRPEVAASTAGDLSVRIGTSFRQTWPRPGELLMQEEGFVQVRFDEPAPVDRVLAVTSSARALVSLAANQQCEVTQLNLTHPAVRRSTGPDQSEPVRLTYFPRFGGRPAPAATHTTLGFDCADLGGVASLATWLVNAESHQHLLGALLARQSTDGLVVEMRLIASVLAAEALDRLLHERKIEAPVGHDERVERVIRAAPPEDRPWLQDRLEWRPKRPVLRARLRRLLDKSGPAFATMAPDPEEWSIAVATARNRLEHADASRPQPSALTTHVLAESLRLVVAACLLNDAGISPEGLERFRDDNSYEWIRSQLGQDRRHFEWL